MLRYAQRLLLLCLGCALILVGCRGQGSPGTAVELYLQAVVAKDPVRAINLSCTAWEAQARAEASSFEAVKVRLENLACSETGADGDSHWVTCSGDLIATYQGGDQSLSLQERTYRVILEDGAWKMCGYQ
jgi:hypothetical protein